MAGGSKKGQYDIVDQAEDVVRAYIKRYFCYDKKTSKKGKAYDLTEKRLIITTLILCIALAVLVTLLFLWF